MKFIFKNDTGKKDIIGYVMYQYSNGGVDTFIVKTIDDKMLHIPCNLLIGIDK